MVSTRLLAVRIILVLSTFLCSCGSLHSDKDPILSYTTLEWPFRMQRINVVWEKARRNLSEGKLKRLFSELKLRDKDEAELKRLKAQSGGGGLDNGLREAQARKELSVIMKKYGLLDFNADDDVSIESVDRDQPKHYFSDKKLNRLWSKAEKAGLSDDDLLMLKQEFRHHEEKVKQYNELLEMSAHLDKKRLNEIVLDDRVPQDDDEAMANPNHLDNTAEEVKKNYERLHRLATNTHAKEFEEDQVQALWKLAQEADFTPDELESLRTELHHFEARLSKVNYLQEELRVADLRHGRDFQEDSEGETQGRKKLVKNLTKHKQTAKEVREHLERTIAARHSEL